MKTSWIIHGSRLLQEIKSIIGEEAQTFFEYLCQRVDAIESATDRMAFQEHRKKLRQAHAILFILSPDDLEARRLAYDLMLIPEDPSISRLLVYLDKVRELRFQTDT